MAERIISFARCVDDFIIDRLMQPAVNLACWYLGLPLYTLARACIVLGAGIGAIWIHRYDTIPSADFLEDILCLLVMAGTAFMQIRTHERSAPRRPALAPAVRLTGLIWRTLWLLDLALFPSQWPVLSHAALFGSFAWTLLLVLPYWLICCRQPPPPEPLARGEFRPATIPVR
ncbi:hypothetical protein [Acidocella aromatica]|uniref:Uncharacterized protein n=1 Tax=Acidocella aromatica TaxID=1303579 RepID=A0A840VMX2_9PROT|nr:hypothetical protein [Acidocella aromatica]MBB5372941.1 hypothetical protein [Acidocella aromatica]